MRASPLSFAAVVVAAALGSACPPVADGDGAGAGEGEGEGDAAEGEGEGDAGEGEGEGDAGEGEGEGDGEGEGEGEGDGGGACGDVDVDGDGLGDACDPCTTEPCAWPAEDMADAVNLTSLEPDWDVDLSGAVWDETNQRLWVCMNTLANSGVWALVRDGAGNFSIDEPGGARGEWRDFGDLESLTLVDEARPFDMFLLIERVGAIEQYDMSVGGAEVLVHSWNVEPDLPSADGVEGLTFVPDEELAAGGFVDGSGAPAQSALGMGGLFFIGHQQGGNIYVFDVDPGADDAYVFVGEYATGATETAGLDYDRSTGHLFILHGGGFNDVEVTRLSSVADGNIRRLDSVHTYQGPPPAEAGNDNYEGIALTPAVACDQPREFVLAVDGGGADSLFAFQTFPCF